MSIIITGAAGFIGSVLLARLNDLGETDILAVDQEARHSAKWNNIRDKKFSEYLDSGEFMERLEKGSFSSGVSAVFHMGACSDTTEKNRSYLRKNNTEYSKKLALWCVRQKSYLAYASSAATYGNGEHGFSDEDDLTPRLQALNPYGQSKLDFDQWVLQHGMGTQITGFRFFNVYGPNEYHKGNMRSLVQKGFEQIRDTGKLRLFKSYVKKYPDGGQKRDFLYVKDAVDAMIWFYQNQKWKGIYNLGTGRAQTWNDLAKALFNSMRKSVNIEYVDMPDSIKSQYQYFTEADLGKLRRTGCPADYRNLDAGVRDYVQNYLLKDNSFL